jgi:hypothetical protein
MYIRDQVIQILTLAQTEMRQAADQISPEREISPGWQIREVLAHIAGWDELLASVLDAHGAGKQYSQGEFPDTDSFNQQSLEARAGLSLEQVTTDWEACRESLIGVLQEMAPERFEQPVLFPWGQVGTVEDILRGFAAHERRHAGEILVICS